MITLAVGPNQDMVINASNSLVLLSGKEALAQTIGQICRTRRGEMALYKNIGVPFWDSIFQTKDVIMFEAAMRAEISRHPEVTGIDTFEVTIDGNEIKYTGTIRSIYGEIPVNG